MYLLHTIAYFHFYLSIFLAIILDLSHVGTSIALEKLLEVYLRLLVGMRRVIDLFILTDLIKKLRGFYSYQIAV